MAYARLLIAGDRHIRTRSISQLRRITGVTTLPYGVEIDRDGKEVWSRDGFTSVVDAQRLPDGGTLTAEIDGTCIKLNSDGDEISRTEHGSASRVLE